MAPNVTPMMPTGKQMDELGLSQPVRQQLRHLGMQILRRLLAPLVMLRKAKKARRQLTLSWHLSTDACANTARCSGAAPPVMAGEEARRAVEQSFLYTSALAFAMPALDESGSPKAGGKPPRPIAGSPMTAGDAFSSDTPVVGVDADCAEQCENAFQGDWERQHADSDRDAVAAVHSMLETVAARATLHGYVRDEYIQWFQEPAHAVLVLLAGTVVQTAPLHASNSPPQSMTSPRHLLGSRRLSSPNTSRRPSTAGSMISETGSVNAGGAGTQGGKRRLTVALDSHMLAVRARPSRALPNGGSSGSTLIKAIRRASDAQLVMCDEDLAAPVVLGEAACLGGFPHCAKLRVSSVTALIARISLEDYCGLVAATPRSVQRNMLCKALQARERLLPFYAPMTLARLRLCPLLSLLSSDDLRHVLDHIKPCVFAAGMRCSEREDPKHIFFVRRGVVRVERDGFAEVVGRSANCPSARTLLVEGHTFGETACIFRESLGDAYYAVSHVDAYMLPFRVLIQLMKQQPEVQSVVYNSARVRSSLKDNDVPGIIFSPPCGLRDINGVSGVVSRHSTLIHGEPRRRSSLAGGGGTAVGSVRAGSPRRVTIFEGMNTLAPTSVAVYGAVEEKMSVGLLAALSNIPLISMLATPEFLSDAVQCWNSVQIEKGDYVVRRGDECNRILFFYEGRAAIVVDEKLYTEEMQAGRLGSVDVSTVGVLSRALQRIPQGHMVGYTCMRRHRWTRSIIALDECTELWELSRAVFVALLRKHELDKKMAIATQQLLQPLLVQRERLVALDYQPLLRPMPSSLWSEHPIVNTYPTNTLEVCVFPLWKEGDFPLDREGVTSRRGTRGSVSTNTLALDYITRDRHASSMSQNEGVQSQ